MSDETRTEGRSAHRALVAHYPGPSAHMPGCRDIAYLGFRAPPQPWNEPQPIDRDPSEFEDLREVRDA